MEILKSGLTLGAEIIGVDLGKELEQEKISEINKAWDENLVLVFKNQN